MSEHDTRIELPAEDGVFELWRASFSAPASAMPAILEELEDLALSVSVFEEEADAEQTTIRWRIDLLFRDEPERAVLEPRIEAIASRHGFAIPGLEIDPLGEEDWLEATAMRSPPVIAGRFCVHGAHARNCVPEDLVRIEIEAGLAFGSGDHQTTRACLLAMDRLFRRRRFARTLDMGCGTAVLAIAAAKAYRARRITAVDNDPIAVRVARENVRKNGVADKIRCLVSEGYADPRVAAGGAYDLILANILADPLCEMAGDLAANLAPAGRAVLSGFLGSQRARVAAAHQALGLVVMDEILVEPWVALVIGKPPFSRRPRGRVRRARRRWGVLGGTVSAQ